MHKPPKADNHETSLSAAVTDCTYFLKGILGLLYYNLGFPFVFLAITSVFAIILLIVVTSEICKHRSAKSTWAELMHTKAVSQDVLKQDQDSTARLPAL